MEAACNGEHSQAEQWLRQAVAARPNDPVLREQLADILAQQGKRQPAIEQLTRAIELNKADAASYVKLGSLYLQNGQWIPASQFARKAIQVDRSLPEAWAFRGETKLAKGHFTEALSDYQRALSLRDDYPEVQLKVAQIHRQLGHPLRAFSTVERLLNQTPPQRQSEPALMLAAELLIEIQQPAQAIRRLQMAASRPDVSAECLLQLSEIQLAVGRSADAAATLTRARQLYPDSGAIAAKLRGLNGGDAQIASAQRMQDVLSR